MNGERARRMHLRAVRNRKAARERRLAKDKKRAEEIQMEFEMARTMAVLKQGGYRGVTWV